MASISELYQIYSNLDTGDLSGNQKKQMYSLLGSMKPSDVRSIDDHRHYVELVQKLRQASMDDMELFGQRFLATLKSLLSVGEDGVYSNQLRFLYELIQNVDDCDYEDVSDCKLDIRFSYEKDPGRIILTYNEIGFTPENVFAITGIAEKSKNISADKVEIGEKGIGFKSVFGIAKRVLIESGLFSFELDADNFTVPIPRYEGYVPVRGTRLTLEMSANDCQGIYRKIVDQYMTQSAMLNQNPILFLNKLTHLKMHFDEFRYIEFDVQRSIPEKHGDLSFEPDTTISVDMKDCVNGIDRVVKNEIRCYRYSMPITYGKTECLARYGDDTKFTERKHKLVAIFPILPKEMDSYTGVLYSFLPTQVKMTAPIILHVPYKLGGSREYVDSHNNDAWFQYTNKKLAAFLELVYLDLAHFLKQEVIRYIPNRHKNFFKGDSDKTNCLKNPGLSGDYICSKKVFYTEEGSFEDVSNIVAFGIDESIDDPVVVHKMLENPYKLFVPGYPVDMKWYGCQVIENAQGKLFKHGLEKSALFESILTWLEKNNSDLSYYKLLNAYEPTRFNAEHLAAVAHHGQLWNASITNARKQIADNKKMPLCQFVGSIPEMEADYRNQLLDIIKDADLSPAFLKYLQIIDYRFFVVENKREFAVAANNGVALAKGRELGSFAKLARLFDQHGTFAASMEIRQSSEKLNQVDESLSNQEYLSLLHSVRKSLMDAFGERMYKSYIKIIAEAGTDKNRFFSELLQNADDCIYPNNSTPFFKLSMDGTILTVSYNEKGFTKDNVRAITAIGESTKKMLLSGEDKSIGEKGVGFKSVFGVAKSVEIHSNGFDFKLTRQLPTVPEMCKPIENHDGTTMIFQMEKEIRSTFTLERILQLCMCLRNLRHLEILNHTIDIFDDKDRRVIIVDRQKYTYERIVHEFVVTDSEALANRNQNNKKIDARQRIICYLPEKIRGQEMYLYSGLPLLIKSNVPLVVDAPFELTTSRENVLHNRWNDIVKEHLYKAIIDVMYAKIDTGLEVLRYVGFRSQNNVSSWQNFDDAYLNNYNWPEALRKAQILPILGSDEKVSINQGRCVLVPEFIAKMQETDDISSFFSGAIIDMIGKNQYAQMLEAIGCRKANENEILNFLEKKTVMYIFRKEFRDGLYAYLSNNQGNFAFGISQKAAFILPIFPIRMKETTKYTTFSPKIYAHKNAISTDDYYILNTSIMSLEQADKILSGKRRINELTQEVLDAKYQKTLKEYIENPQKKYTAKQIAVFVLNEFKNNFDAFKKCKFMLIGLMPRIPFQMSNGLFKNGKKFLNSRNQWYAGSLIQTLVVHEKYKDLAKFLECKEVETIHFDDIDFKIEDILDDDIEDLQCDFVNFYEIIINLINKGFISDEQIEKYHLEFGVGNRKDNDPYEEFPDRAVSNISKLKNHIKETWKSRPNPYIEKQYIKWKPKYSLSKTEYTNSMYGSYFNENKCFCQMCRKRTLLRYIERNDIEKNPAYAWEQMYLSLCLNCSKDYILLRNNSIIWRQFVNCIMNVNVLAAGAFEIPIGGKSITFTATHLAEIQEIFKNEGWGDRSPKRKPIIGKSIDNEESI